MFLYKWTDLVWAHTAVVEVGVTCGWVNGVLLEVFTDVLCGGLRQKPVDTLSEEQHSTFKMLQLKAPRTTLQTPDLPKDSSKTIKTGNRAQIHTSQPVSPEGSCPVSSPSPSRQYRRQPETPEHSLYPLARRAVNTNHVVYKKTQKLTLKKKETIPAATATLYLKQTISHQRNHQLMSVLLPDQRSVF